MMPLNTGTPPNHEKVDARFRNGTIAHGINPKLYRWNVDTRFPKDGDWDITAWRAAV